MNGCKAWLAVCAVVGLLTSTANAVVNIETVRVGNPGNAGDSRYGGYGAVSYTYNIGKYEVTAGQYTEFLNAVAATDTYMLYNTGMAKTNYGSGISRSGEAGSFTYSVDAAFVNRPVNFVSYWDACRFTNWLQNGQPKGLQDAGTTERGTYTLDGYRGFDGRTIQRNPGSTWAMTSENEWYKAAYYNPATGSYYEYPTSSNTAPGHDLADASGNNANYATSSQPNPIYAGIYTTLVGEFQNSDSPYGTFDQGGNVWEWNEAIGYRDDIWAHRGRRGGSCLPYLTYLRAFHRGGSSPAVEDMDAGFRLVLVPEPTTLTLLALGAFVLRRAGRR